MDRQRKWFSDDYFDLIVWFAEDAIICGFQLGYDRSRVERAFTWTSTAGYSHNRIDDGEAHPTKNQTPILVPDGAFDAAAIAARLTGSSATIDSEVRAFVVEKILSYPRQRQRA